MNHTPGPWIISETLIGGEPDCNIRRVRSHQGKEELICELNGNMNIWSPVDQANANLIAAAPALLATLKYLQEELLKIDDPEGWSRELEAIGTAITAAEGKTT